MGVVLGGLDAALAGSLPVALPMLFTRSPHVANQMALAAPILSLCLLLHALSNMLEGILFATKDVEFFSRMYPASSVVVMLLFARQRSATVAPILSEVWYTFFVYQGLRFLQCAWRVVQNQRSNSSSSRSSRSNFEPVPITDSDTDGDEERVENGIDSPSDETNGHIHAGVESPLQNKRLFSSTSAAAAMVAL